MEKPLETCQVCPQVEWSRVSGNDQDGLNSVSQVDEASYMAPSFELYGGWAQQKNNGLCQQFCLGESCLFSSHPDGRQSRSSPYVPGAF